MKAIETLVERTPTPFFVLDLEAIDRAAGDVRNAFGAAVFYMLKCNSHPDVLTRLAQNGLGFAFSHASELALVARHAPEAPLLCAAASIDRSLLAAAAKFDLQYVSLFTQQSYDDWLALRGDSAGIVRLVQGSGKFGISHSAFHHPRIAGGHVHAGTAVTPERWAALLNASYSLPVVDGGGGFLGPMSLACNLQSIRDYAGGLHIPLAIVEPGRYLVESAMTCVSRVVDVDGDRVYLDVGSNLLPPLTSAAYVSLGVLGDETDKEHTYRLFDSGCMDVHYLPDLAAREVVQGDIVMIGNCGAYTYSLWSTFGGEHAPVIPVEAACDAALS